MKKRTILISFLMINTLLVFSQNRIERLEINSTARNDETVTNDLATEGTYQILIRKQNDSINLSSESLKEIERKRDEFETVEIILEGYTVIIMSRQKVNKGILWPKYKETPK